MKRLLFLTAIGLLVFRCSSNKDINPKIVGEWKLIETFNGYANGGDFKWTTVPNTYSEIIQLTSNGRYFENIDSKEVQRQCTGTYRLLPDSVLEITSSCQTYPIQNEIELMQATLIINIQVREGIIRRKYTSTN
ncbi:MAG: hypothetical protein JXR03_09725 [Cyclobacteriaceae bacterium]